MHSFYWFGIMKYSLKNPQLRWFFFIAGTAIVLFFFWKVNDVVTQLQKEEQQKVKIWADAVSRKARFMEHTEAFFHQVAKEEQIKLQQFITAHKFILSQPLDAELNFYYDVIVNNRSIPVIITDEFNNIQLSQNINLPPNQKVLVGDLLKQFSKNPPFEYYVSGMTFRLYYCESKAYTDLKETLMYFTGDFLNELVNNSVLIPVVITDSTEKRIIASGNIDKTLIDKEHLAETLDDMERENGEILLNLPGNPNAKIFYTRSQTIKALQYYPFGYSVLLFVFGFLIFRLFKTMKKNEQNSMWIGMNKETAHQLGTPISALIAWVEYLKLQPENEEICTEITKDINRLNRVTQRFSQIGKQPELVVQDVIPVVDNAMNYLISRSSKKITYNINLPQGERILLPINQYLFEWTLENLLKNAIDAMSGIGTFTLDLKEDSKRVFIDMSDTGKGISKRMQRKIFEPGYTTKERGWGMGLSLAKRIIEEYHHGKISVKQSAVGKGTTFRIVLKKK